MKKTCMNKKETKMNSNNKTAREEILMTKGRRKISAIGTVGSFFKIA